MKFYRAICLATAILLTACGLSMAGDLSGTVRVGHTFVDDEGDRSVNQSSFNIYEGGRVLN